MSAAPHLSSFSFPSSSFAVGRSCSSLNSTTSGALDDVQGAASRRGPGDSVVKHNSLSGAPLPVQGPIMGEALRSRPRLLDLFCGRGGWSAPFLRAGWECVGFDVRDFGYRGRLVCRPLPLALPELCSWRPDLVLASPPCEEFARRCLPWIRAERPVEFDRAVSLLRWSVSLVGQLGCPVVVECSRFAARYVPGARFVGSYALWGDVPALLPDLPRRKERFSGRDPSRRAVIEPELSSWVFDVLGRRCGRFTRPGPARLAC